MAEHARAPNVSVVMIFLDAQAFIAESIESVLAQTYRDFELILVDDGSSDGSTAIARAYAERHPEHVRYTEHEGHRNLGMSASRNHGVRVGRGQLISFLDADDVWLPERLERFVTELARYPTAGLMCGPTFHWYTWAGPRAAELLGRHADQVRRVGLPVHTLLEAPEPLRRWLKSRGSTVPSTCSLLIRRHAYEAVGGFEPSFRGLFEDQVFLSKLALHAPFVALPDVLAYYRQHPGSACRQAIGGGGYNPAHPNPARERYLLWLESYRAERGIRHPGLGRDLWRELLPYRLPAYRAFLDGRRDSAYYLREFLRSHLPRGVFHEVKGWANKVRWTLQSYIESRRGH